MVKGNCMKEIKQLKRKHMRETTAAKKKKSTLEHKLPLLQDNLTTLTG